MQQYADLYLLQSHSTCLHTVASSWTFLLTLNHDARNHVFKKKERYMIYLTAVG